MSCSRWSDWHPGQVQAESSLELSTGAVCQVTEFSESIYSLRGKSWGLPASALGIRAELPRCPAPTTESSALECSLVGVKCRHVSPGRTGTGVARPRDSQIIERHAKIRRAAGSEERGCSRSRDTSYHRDRPRRTPCALSAAHEGASRRPRLHRLPHLQALRHYRDLTPLRTRLQ